ncbi:MAG: V-type ATPase subunit [Candidatus Bathyarchaeota archaeon]|nr:MAG: V-type ATPase subunit [Candidatus Bathyarchaeota archaeon]
MKAWKYRRLMPKVMVARLQLIKPATITDLVGRDWHTIHSTLLTTPYQTAISSIPPSELNGNSVEKALLTHYISTLHDIKIHSPKEIAILTSTIMNKFEARNVKSVLRARWAGVSVSDALAFIVPAERMDEKRCVHILEHSENIDDVIGQLSDLEYGSTLKLAFESQKPLNHLLPLETAIDRIVYGQIIKAVEKLRGLDKHISQTVIGLEIASVNLKTVLRSKSLGIEHDHIIPYLLPSEMFGKKTLDAIISTADIRAFLESLLAKAQRGITRDFQYMLTDSIQEYTASQSLPRIEMVLDKYLLKTSLRMLKRYTPFFNIGLLLAFLNAKWFEIRNLRIIMSGARAHQPPNRIKDLLILPE